MADRPVDPWKVGTENQNCKIIVRQPDLGGQVRADTGSLLSFRASSRVVVSLDEVVPKTKVRQSVCQ